jgi:hypothetical protein
MSLRGRIGLLADREFRLLWLGRSLSSIGDAIVPVAVSFAVLELGTARDSDSSSAPRWAHACSPSS